MTEIYLIRHTQAEGNRYRMMQGSWDGEVTERGKQQIEALIDENSAIKTLEALYKDVNNSTYGTEEERREQETLDVLLAVFEVLFEHASA